MQVFGVKLPAMSSLVLWGLLWEVVGQMGLTFFLPPLSQVIVTLFEIIGTPPSSRRCGKPAMLSSWGCSSRS